MSPSRFKMAGPSWPDVPGQGGPICPPRLLQVCKEHLRWAPRSNDYEECDEMEQETKNDGEDDLMPHRWTAP